ncbi:MAG: glutamine-hydrolyzing GMP synthase [Eubacteriales bacterium]
MSELIAILDCGGQYTKVIDRKVRELGVKSDILSIGAPTEKLRDYDAFILSGGPSSIYDMDAPVYNPDIFGLGKPILGICYGMHLINKHFGGEVVPGLLTEYGQVNIATSPACPLFDGLDGRQRVLMSHGDSVKTPAPGFEVAAVTGEVTAALYDAKRKIMAVQFHPEVELTENGLHMLENFLRKISGLKDTYALEDRIEASIKMIQKRVGEDNVVVLVSGGVDSAVSAALLIKALPADKIFAIHIDHGLMRKNESDAICEGLKKLGLKNLTRVNASEYFFDEKIEVSEGMFAPPLSTVNDPETKRRIIGRAFVDVTRKAAQGLGLDFDKTFLAQGTLRPDLIESGNPDVSSHATVIKTHHNDVDIIRRAREKGLIIETNWDWHKDEVRQVALKLGLDREIAYRQPFPGPGLGVRIICCDGPEPIKPEDIKAFAAVLDTLNKRDGYSFGGVIAPVRSVGVQGDSRSYKSLAVLDGYGEDVSWYDVFALVRDIPNNVRFINRCGYLLDRQSIGGELKCGGAKVNGHTAHLLQELDYIVNSHIKGERISQCFAVLVPIGVDKPYSVAVRAVVTSDFMTARPAVPGKDFPLQALSDIVSQIKSGFGDEIDMVLYDATGKPPATVEWE